LNNWIARQNAEIIIDACNQYKNKDGIFPERLEDLVPNYIKKIP